MQRIGILRGGISPEFQFSLETGAEVARAVQDAGFEAIDMLLDRQGVLHIKGIPANLEEMPLQADYIWNALHGIGAEDGQMADLLEGQAIPYSGSSKVASSITQHKERAKEIARSLGIKAPQSILIMPEGDESIAALTRRIYTTMAPPWIVKPLVGGGSHRTFVAHTMLDLSQMVEDAISHQEPFLVEQYIFGKEAAVGVIDGFRNQETYTLPVIEITRASQGILSEDMRKDIGLYTKVGGNFNSDERQQLSDFAKKLHQAFGVKDYSQSEFIIDPYHRIWFIETDTHPHLRSGSPFLKALDAVGATLKDFVKTILER